MKTKNILKAIKAVRKELKVGGGTLMTNQALATLDALYLALANKTIEIEEDDTHPDLPESAWAEIYKQEREQREKEFTEANLFYQQKANMT